MRFGGLDIAYDDRILTPRAWTTLQAEWAAEVLAAVPQGPVLELGAGAGHIGLLTICHRRRSLVSVDASPVACAYARANAEAAGLGDLVEVRQRDIEAAVEPGERFALVLADPPWVPSEETVRYPADPPGAIDGGPDGLDVARVCVRVAAPHLPPGGAMLLQLGTRQQAADLADQTERSGLVLTEVREGECGVVARLTPVA